MYVANWMQTDPAGMQSMIDSYYGAQRPRPAGAAQGQGDVEQDAMDQIQAFYKGGRQPQSPQAQPAGRPQGAGAGWAGFKGYDPQGGTPGNGALGLRPGELGDVTSGGGQIGLDNTPAQPVGVPVGSWRTASPAQVLSPAGLTSNAGGARPGYMTGSEFATAMNGGTLRDPANINLKDMERYILHGNGQLNGVSPAQRAGVLQAFLGANKQAEGLMAQDTSRIGILGNLGIEGGKLGLEQQKVDLATNPKAYLLPLLQSAIASGKPIDKATVKGVLDAVSPLAGAPAARSQVGSNVPLNQFAADRNGATASPQAPAPAANASTGGWDTTPLTYVEELAKDAPKGETADQLLTRGWNTDPEKAKQNMAALLAEANKLDPKLVYDFINRNNGRNLWVDNIGHGGMFNGQNFIPGTSPYIAQQYRRALGIGDPKMLFQKVADAWGNF